MKRATALAAAVMIFLATLGNQSASAYLADVTLPAAGGCPALDRWNISTTQPLNRRWSTSLPLAPVTLLTVAAENSSAQLAEIEDTISAAFSAWAAVPGTTFNATNYPGAIGPLSRVSAAAACSNDSESNIDGLNTICFNQSSMGFTTGVLVGLAQPGDFGGPLADVCPMNSATPCTTPTVDTNFNPRALPAGP